MQLTQEQYQALKLKGWDDAKIKAVAQSQGYEMSSVEGGLKEELEQRGTEMLKAGERYQLRKQTFPETILQAGGQIAGGITDVALAGVKAITPEFIEEPIKKGLQKIGEIPVVQDMAMKYQSWATQNPRAAADLEAVVNIASLIPVGKGAQVAGKGVLKGTEVGFKTVGATGRAGKAVGEKVVELGIGISAKEAPLLQMYKAKNTFIDRVGAILKGEKLGEPITGAITATEKGLVGTKPMIGIQSRRATEKLWNEIINPALETMPDKVNIKTFFTDLAKTIDKTQDLARKNVLKKALNALWQDYKKVGDVSYKQLQKFKEGWAEFVPEKAYKGQSIKDAFNEVRNLASKQARQTIYDKLGDAVKRAYLDYGNLKGLMKMGQREMVKGLIPEGGSFTGIKKMLDTVITPITTVGGQVVYKVGKGLELIGEKGAKTVGDLLKK